MQHKLFHFHASTHVWHYLWSEAFLCLVYAMLVFVAPVGALAQRLEDRGLFMQSSTPGVTTSYTVSFQYASPDAVGSVDMLFCLDPIPYMACVPPTGLDVSRATLISQTGETGFSISSISSNHILISRSPTAPTTLGDSSYTFSGIVNPTDISQSFAIRLQSHGTTDASDPQIDFGSVEGQVTQAIMLEAQVPPMLVFCEAQEVDDGCTSTDETFNTDMGAVDPNSALVAHSQFAVGTNASQGFVVTANGVGPAAGTDVISSPTTPTPSVPGTNQFGINLVQNTDPAIGDDPEGTWANAVPSTDYSEPNKYMFVSGDVIASSANVSLMKKFTVSYILNASPDLRAGVYSTTITYIASGRF